MSTKKNIWIINEYAGSIYHGMEYRHFYLAKNFIQQGFNVTIISATFSHLYKYLPENNESYNSENIDGIEYVWIKVPKYKDSKDKIRVIKWFIFAFKLYFLPFKKMKNPDAIIMSSAAPFSIFPSFYLRKKFKAKLIFEVKDIWPLSLINIGSFSEKHPFIRLMSYAENKAITKSDFVVSNLPNYKKHIENLGIKKPVYWMPNGIDYDGSSKISLNETIEKVIPKDKFIIGYAGTVGQANALQYLLESAKLLINNDNIRIVIVGNGLEKENYKKYCKENNLTNVIFVDAIDKEEIPAMLDLFDVCYIGWNNEKLYEFGIAANKIFDYMLAEKPILHSYNGKGDIVKMYKCGISVEAENPTEITKGIIVLYNTNKKDLATFGENGRKKVLENFTYKEIASNYLEILFK